MSDRGRGTLVTNQLSAGACALVAPPLCLLLLHLQPIRMLNSGELKTCKSNGGQHPTHPSLLIFYSLMVQIILLPHFKHLYSSRLAVIFCLYYRFSHSNHLMTKHPLMFNSASPEPEIPLNDIRCSPPHPKDNNLDKVKSGEAFIFFFRFISQ